MTTRRGFTLIESCAAAALLAAVLGIAVALLTSIHRQRQSASFHARAIMIADNLLERLTAEPFDAITAGRANELQQASSLAELLPDGTAAIEVTAVESPPPGKRIEVRIEWQPRSGGPTSRYAVATWVFHGKSEGLSDSE